MVGGRGRQRTVASGRLSVMTVDTKNAPRRTLTFASIDDLDRDLQQIQSAIDAGTVGHTGNWTPGQICEHCAKFVRFAIDGFPSHAPGFVRFFARMFLLKKAVGPEPLEPGFQLPKQAAVMLPGNAISDATGVAELRKEIQRLRDGAQMTAKSPLLGPLTHDQWLVLQLKHCAMHLSFVKLS